MSEETMIGKYVRYFDPIGFEHTGYIVGEEGEFYLVQSDNPNITPAEWHFKIKKALAPLVVQGDDSDEK